MHPVTWWLEMLQNGSTDADVARMVLHDIIGTRADGWVAHGDIAQLLSLLTAIRLDQLSKSS